MFRSLLQCALLSVALTVTGASASTPDRNRINFLLHCSGCHQQDGSGNPEHGIPDMRGSLGHFLRLPEGRAFLVQVPGTAQSALGDAAVADLLNWMVVNFSREEIPLKFTPYTTPEITYLRARRPEDIPAQRAAVVEGLRAMGYRIE